MLELSCSGIVTSILLVILSRRVRPTLVSPVYVLILVYLGVFILGALFYDPQYASPDMDVSNQEIVRIISKIFWIVSAFISGALLFATVSQDRKQLQRPINISAVDLSQSQAMSGIVLSIACVGLTVIGTGATNLWYRQEYLVHENQVLQILGGGLFLPSVFALGVIMGQRSSVLRFLAVAIFGVIEILSAALSTRSFALLPIIFCVGCLLAQPKNRKFRAALAIILLLTPLLMMVPLATRSMTEQGFSTFPQILEIASQIDLRDQLQAVLNNVLFSVPLTIHSAMPIAENAFDYVLVNIDPTPGVWSGWYNKELRINEFIPFSAIGDLLRAGTWIAILYYSVVGVYFARIDARIRSVGRIGPGSLLLIAMTFGFIVFSLQYSLRTATRLIYYAIAIEFFLWIASIVTTRYGPRLSTVLPTKLEPSSRNIS
jgi:hypothetical protein